MKITASIRGDGEGEILLLAIVVITMGTSIQRSTTLRNKAFPIVAF
jgi:hypothetical protein